jgi:aryl-alcohol dehydrogenase-like predicted oxidoreductase
MKLALGTVQFGLPYGIANQGGQVKREEVGKILAFAHDSGIDTLDTAAVYGESEVCLGEISTQGFKLVTKLPPLPQGNIDVGVWVETRLRASLSRLNVDSIYAVLIHRTENLMGARGHLIVQSLQRFKAAGMLTKIGISIYHTRELDAVWKAYPIDLVQAPFSIVDRRLVTTGWLQRLHADGVEVHVRSIFLQGLLLMTRKSIPEKFKPWLDLFGQWHTWLEENRVGAKEACLAFVSSQALIDRVVVGVESREQLQELIRWQERVPLPQFPDLSCEDERLINPSNWNLL